MPLVRCSVHTIHLSIFCSCLPLFDDKRECARAQFFTVSRTQRFRTTLSKLSFFFFSIDNTAGRRSTKTDRRDNAGVFPRRTRRFSFRLFLITVSELACKYIYRAGVYYRDRPTLWYCSVRMINTVKILLLTASAERRLRPGFLETFYDSSVTTTRRVDVECTRKSNFFS